MEERTTISGIPSEGPLSSLREDDETGEAHSIVYGGSPKLHMAYRIPINLLHFNIENGRYATLHGLLEAANPGVNIDPTTNRWREEILQLLNGTWEDKGIIGANTGQEKSFFDQLVNDIKVRGQERPGVVMANGAVMSGNRRLAALVTLNNERPDAIQFQHLNAFIVPGDMGMTTTDRWRLEISQQMGQGRLMRDYTPANRLLKIREGIQGFMREQGKTLDEAIDLVAFDFGVADSKIIQDDYNSLTYIDEYLDAIKQPGAYWLINDKTETFTEFLALEESIKTNKLPLAQRAELKRTVFSLIFNGSANHDFMRKVRQAVGPRRATANARRPSKESVQILTENAPRTEDLGKVLSTKEKAEIVDTARNFESQLQASNNAETPLTKSNRAAMDLLAVAQSIAGDEIDVDRIEDLNSNLNKAKRHLSSCFEQLEKAG